MCVNAVQWHKCEISLIGAWWESHVFFNHVLRNYQSRLLIKKRSICCSINICKMGTFIERCTVIIMCVNAVQWHKCEISQTIDSLQLFFLAAALYNIEIVSQYLLLEDNWIADPISNLTRLLTCSHSSKTAPPIVYVMGLGIQCQNYEQSCRPSLVWHCCQHSLSLQNQL